MIEYKPTCPSNGMWLFSYLYINNLLQHKSGFWWPYFSMRALEHNCHLQLEDLKPRPPNGCFRKADIHCQNSKCIPSFSIRNLRQDLLLVPVQLVALTDVQRKHLAEEMLTTLNSLTTHVECFKTTSPSLLCRLNIVRYFPELNHCPASCLATLTFFPSAVFA